MLIAGVGSGQPVFGGSLRNDTGIARIGAGSEARADGHSIPTAAGSPRYPAQASPPSPRPAAPVPPPSPPDSSAKGTQTSGKPSNAAPDRVCAARHWSPALPAVGRGGNGGLRGSGRHGSCIFRAPKNAASGESAPPCDPPIVSPDGAQRRSGVQSHKQRPCRPAPVPGSPLRGVRGGKGGLGSGGVRTKSNKNYLSFRFFP